MTQEKLENLLSFRRIEPYKTKSSNWLEAYAVELSQAKDFYTHLHFLEIFLRNKINNEFKKIFGEWLFVRNSRLKLNFREQEKINDVLILLQQAKKEIDQDNVISNLSFGFWTNLFHKSYNYQIWQQNKMIERVFPYLSSSERNLKTIQQEMEMIRKFRNRIFHFENLREYDLQKTRSIIDKFIYGISELKISDIFT